MATAKLSIADFAAKIKAKYPDYANVDDSELTSRIIAKYPDYADMVEQNPRSSVSVTSGGSNIAVENNGREDPGFFTGLYETTLKPFAGIKQLQDRNVSDHGQVLGTLKTYYDFAKGLLTVSPEAQAKISKAVKDGNFLEFVQNAPSLLGGLGEATVKPAELAQEGKWGEAAGQVTGLVGSAYLGNKIPEVKSVPSKIRGGLQKASDRMIESALKPGPEKYSPAERAEMVGTIQREKIPVSPSGQEKLYSLIEKINKEREGIVENAPGPGVELTPKANPPQLTQGARQMPPTTPAPGTTQTVLADPDIATTPVQFGKFSEIGNLEQRTGKTIKTTENRYPEQVESKLNNAVNAQLIDVIDQRARETGLLKAAQDAAQAAGQPVPGKFSDIFDIKLKNVIFPKDVAKRVDQIVARYRTVLPESNLAAIEAAKQEFLRNYPNPLSLKEAQKLKSTTYSEIGSRPYMDKAAKPGSVTATEQALARGLMEELADQIPEIKAINARETKLFGLKPALDQAVNRIRNWEIFAPGIYGSLAGISTAVGTGSIEAGAVATAMITILRNPNVKSRLAIAMSSAAKRGGKSLSGVQAKAILDSYVSRLAASVNISESGGRRENRSSEQTQ